MPVSTSTFDSCPVAVDVQEVKCEVDQNLERLRVHVAAHRATDSLVDLGLGLARDRNAERLGDALLVLQLRRVEAVAADAAHLALLRPPDAAGAGASTAADDPARGSCK